ncbi:uncharacterized protein LOC144108704 [Amblyomma americanum]
MLYGHLADLLPPPSVPGDQAQLARGVALNPSASKCAIATPSQYKEAGGHGCSAEIMLLIPCILVVTITFIIAVAAGLLGPPQQESTVDASSRVSISVPRRTWHMTVTVPTTESTTTTSTSTTTTTTHFTKTLPTTTRRPLTPTSFICTVGVSLNRSMTMPSDGLCDIIFFDSMYKNGINKLNYRSHDNFEYFRQVAAVDKVTTYGAGLDFKALTEINRVLEEPKAYTSIGSLIEDRIFHFGCINTPVFRNSYAGLREALVVLKKINTFLDTKRARGAPLYTALSVSLPKEDERTATSNYFRGVFAPDIVVLYGHLFEEDKQWPDCRILPPTIVNSPIKSLSYTHSLATAVDAIKELKGDRLPTTMWAVSVAMFGRWYKPRYPDLVVHSVPGNYGIYNQCQNVPEYQLASFTEVCKRPICGDGGHESFNSRFCYDKYIERTFTYDTAKTLRAKLCHVKDQYRSTLFSVAAYNLEYDDTEGACEGGTFPVLRTLRGVINFLSEPSEPSRYARCYMESGRK